MADEHHHQTTVSIKEITFTGEWTKYQMNFKVRAEVVNERTKERKSGQTKERMNEEMIGSHFGTTNNLSETD